ncbi:MAG: ABC transporter permease [Candidatus Woesearchaeota archaeon]
MLPITKKIFKDLAREKTFGLAVFLQIILILSMTILLNYTILFYNPELTLKQPLRIGLEQQTPVSKYLEKETKAKVLYYPTAQEGLAAFSQGELDVWIEEKQSNNQTYLEVYVPEDQLKSVVALSVLKQPLEEYEIKQYKQLYPQEKIISLDTIAQQSAQRKGAEKLFEILYGLLLPFLLLVPIFLVGTLVIDVLAEEWETKRIILIKTSTTLSTYLSQVIIAGIALIAVQILLWVGILLLRGIVLANGILLAAYLLLFSLIILFAAAIIALQYKKKAQAQMVYAVVVVFFTAITNLTLFAPVNTIVHIIRGIVPINLWIFAVAGALLLVEAIILAKKIQKEEGESS